MNEKKLSDVRFFSPKQGDCFALSNSDSHDSFFKKKVDYPSPNRFKQSKLPNFFKITTKDNTLVNLTLNNKTDSPKKELKPISIKPKIRELMLHSFYEKPSKCTLKGGFSKIKENKCNEEGTPYDLIFGNKNYPQLKKNKINATQNQIECKEASNPKHFCTVFKKPVVEESKAGPDLVWSKSKMNNFDRLIDHQKIKNIPKKVTFAKTIKTQLEHSSINSNWHSLNPNILKNSFGFSTKFMSVSDLPKKTNFFGFGLNTKKETPENKPVLKPYFPKTMSSIKPLIQNFSELPLKMQKVKKIDLIKEVPQKIPTFNFIHPIAPLGKFFLMI